MRRFRIFYCGLRAAVNPFRRGPLLKTTRALQPVATCRQSPYLRPTPSATKPAIIIVMPFSL